MRGPVEAARSKIASLPLCTLPALLLFDAYPADSSSSSPSAGCCILGTCLGLKEK